MTPRSTARISLCVTAALAAFVFVALAPTAEIHAAASLAHPAHASSISASGEAAPPVPASRDAARRPPDEGPPPKPPTHEEKAEDYFKNIQVLKGSAADEMIPAMQVISASLGVDCEYCHVEHANESDDKKEKATARKMITMTLGINRDSFKGKREVTCNSCHQGKQRPAATPAILETALAPEPGHDEEDEQAAELPSAISVLDKYLEAVGGVEALNKITSRVVKGKMTGFGEKAMPIEVYSQAPDKRVSIVHTPRGVSITAFDGKAGWLANRGRPPRDMSAAETEAARFDADLRLPAHLKDLYKDLRVEPPDEINGHEAVHLVARNKGQSPVEFWFDAKSGLLVRLVRYVETPLGRYPTQIDYREYRTADGVKVPFRWAVSRPGSRFEIKVDQLKQNVPIEGSRFEKATTS